LKVKLPLFPSVRTRTIRRFHWSDSLSMTDSAVLHSFALQWIVCAMWLLSAVSMAFMSTHPACGGGGPARAFMIG